MGSARSLLLLSLVATSAWAHDITNAYEPCHLLCVNEAGRSESRSTHNTLDGGLWGLRLDTVYVSPSGLYEDGVYVPRRKGSTVFVTEFLPSFWYRSGELWRFNVGLPWELNYSRGVVLPTLHADDGAHHEFAAGGIFFSAQRRLFKDELAADQSVWAGLGYRLSSPIGTVDVEGQLTTAPDKAIESLGVGSDDLYLTLSYAGPIGSGPWQLGGGLEPRLHMLPRWQRLYATTLSYYLWAERALSANMSAQLRLSGFYTRIHPLSVSQFTALTLTPALQFAGVGRTAWMTGLSFDVPGTSINRNALQTVNLFVSFSIAFGDRS